MAGAGQFGHAAQGIFSWWIHSWAARRPLAYIGFGMMALKRGRTRAVRLRFVVLAVLAYTYIVSVALSRNPLLS